MGIQGELYGRVSCVLTGCGGVTMGVKVGGLESGSGRAGVSV